ncbi:MAG TPA: UDP-N-acetylglucosamine 1-carboxyvinyltransferase [Candidatus Solibacter sp.]|nr:UDP-N-acetylglucosamine 1-carboxyvinyltransferase [Candidatus Solibacter sp.]
MTHALQVQGGERLNGTVRIGGSKNAALPILAASLLTSEECRLDNLPGLADVATAAEILAELGVAVDRDADSGIRLTASGTIGGEVPSELAKQMRASILLLGPLLARTGEAVVPKPGGDDIGMRRVDQHIYGLRRLGATIEEEDGRFVASADGLHGAEIQLDMPTVTGTENIMMAAALAKGHTTISNAAREPHVSDLATALIGMGARIQGAGSDRIDIDGVERLGGYRHEVVPDYLEAGTYMIAVAAAGGDALLTSCCPLDQLYALTLKLREAGVEVEEDGDTVRVRRQGSLHPVDLITWTHPGFATDLQPQYSALMTQAEGTTVVQEFLFDNRFQYVSELRALGARIDTYTHRRGIEISGPTALRGNIVTIPDIRAGAAIVIAALCARGTTQLLAVEHLERGYEDMAGKLSGLGARVKVPVVQS